MSYIQQVLQPQEVVRYKSTIHWVIYLPTIFLAVLGCCGAAAFFAERGKPDASPSLLMLAFAMMVIALGFAAINFLSAWFTRWTTEVVVTDRRIIFKRGFIRRQTVEMNMNKVESVDVNQSILGRALNYGDVLVRGTGAGLEPLHNIAAPLALRNCVIVH